MGYCNKWAKGLWEFQNSIIVSMIIFALRPSYDPGVRRNGLVFLMHKTLPLASRHCETRVWSLASFISLLFKPRMYHITTLPIFLIVLMVMISG